MRRIAYYDLATKQYFPYTSESFEAAFKHMALAGPLLVKIDNDVYRIRRAGGSLTDIELRAVRLDASHFEAEGYYLLHFRNEDPVRL